MKAVVPLSLAARVLLITPSEPASHVSTCLASNFYGTYGGQSVFIPDLRCLESVDGLISSGSIVDYAEGKELVWVGQKAVEDSVRGFSGRKSSAEELEEFLSQLSARNVPSVAHALSDQRFFSSNKDAIEVKHRSESSVLLSVPASARTTLDEHMPRFWSPTVLPTLPVPLLPASGSAVETLKAVLSEIKFDPVVASIVSSISVRQLDADVRYLTGEDETSPILSRHSFSEGALLAADWLSLQLEGTGATCELRPFLTGFAPNVICRYPSTVNTTATVILGAHYDSRGSFGSTRMPGGDDDGSGTSSVLAIAHVIARKGLTFRSNVELCLFAGEEQGLYGSRGYAADLKAANANVTLMIQSDMIAYRAEGEPLQLGLPATITTPEVAQLIGNLSAIYSPELTVGTTTACCSDHQSFFDQGYASIQMFERAGPIADPMYHNSGDLSDRAGYDFQQVRSIAKVTFAALLHTAGFDLPETSEP